MAAMQMLAMVVVHANHSYGYRCILRPKAAPSRHAVYTSASVDSLHRSDAMRRLQKLAALLLAALVLLGSAGWAAAEASYDLHHAAPGTEQPLPSEHGKAAGDGCASHLSAHLFAPLESPTASARPVHGTGVTAPARVPHVRTVPGGLFRPPRTLLQA